MADLAPPRPANRSDLAYRERGHIVIKHEFLAVFIHDPVDPLLVGAGPEHCRHQRLRLAALKHGRSVRPGQ